VFVKRELADEGWRVRRGRFRFSFELCFCPIYTRSYIFIVFLKVSFCELKAPYAFAVGKERGQKLERRNRRGQLSFLQAVTSFPPRPRSKPFRDLRLRRPNWNCCRTASPSIEPRDRTHLAASSFPAATSVPGSGCHSFWELRPRFVQRML